MDIKKVKESKRKDLKKIINDYLDFETIKKVAYRSIYLIISQIYAQNISFCIQ